MGAKGAKEDKREAIGKLANSNWRLAGKSEGDSPQWMLRAQRKTAQEFWPIANCHLLFSATYFSYPLFDHVIHMIKLFARNDVGRQDIDHVAERAQQNTFFQKELIKTRF